VLDRLLDMARTAINVLADAACTVIVARLEGETGILPDPAKAVGEQKTLEIG
jgi:Na+/H+-dicarboxylate symporter